MQDLVARILSTQAPEGGLPDMPIDAAQITSGNPVARGAILAQSSDRKVTSGVWSCEPGAFDWDYTWDEFVYVMEGSVKIRQEGGEEHLLGPGDTAHFPVGIRTHWEVIEPMRKFFVLRTPEPFEL